MGSILASEWERRVHPPPSGKVVTSWTRKAVHQFDKPNLHKPISYPTQTQSLDETKRGISLGHFLLSFLLPFSLLHLLLPSPSPFSSQKRRRPNLWFGCTALFGQRDVVHHFPRFPIVGFGSKLPHAVSRSLCDRAQGLEHTPGRACWACCRQSL